MPIATKTPDAVVDHTPLPVGEMLAEKKIFKTATANMAIQPPESLVLYMEGMPWTVTSYYSQVIDRDDQVREVDIGASAPLQQYRKISKPEFRVQSELSDSVDADTNRHSVVGTSIISFAIANTFDYFVADVGVRGEGLFMITNVTRKTYNNGSVYEIDYVLLGYTDNGPSKDRFEAIEGRVVKEYHFHKEMAKTGQSGLLTTEEHGNVKKLSNLYRLISEAYIALFVSSRDRIIAVPDADAHVYDGRLSSFVLGVIDYDITPSAAEVNRISHNRDPYLTLASIWTMMEHQDIGMMNLVVPKVVKVSRSFFKAHSLLGSINCWAVDEYIYPDTAAAQAVFKRLEIEGSTGMVSPYIGIPDARYAATVNYAGKDIPLINEANKDGYYVLSGAFYTQNREEMSLLELLVSSYLSRDSIHTGHLLTLMGSYNTWNETEKFYYTPLLLTLMKDAISGYY